MVNGRLQESAQRAAEEENCFILENATTLDQKMAELTAHPLVQIEKWENVTSSRAQVRI